MRRTIPVAALLVAAVLTTWWLAGDRGRRGEHRQPRAGVAEESGAAAVELVPVALPRIADREQVARTPAPPSPESEASSAQSSEPEVHAVLVVWPVDSVTGDVVQGLAGRLERSEGTARQREVVARRDGSIRFGRLEAGVPQRLHVNAGPDHDVLARRDLEPFAPGELRELQVEVDPASVPSYWFRCVDSVSGQPVAGVRVWNFEGGARGASGTAPWRRGEPLGVSETSGLVRLNPHGRGPALVFEAEGFGPGFAYLWAGGTSSAVPTRVELAAPALLELHLAHPGGVPVGGQDVRLLLDAETLGIAHMLLRNQFRLDTHNRLAFDATTDTRGVASFPGLPTRPAGSSPSATVRTNARIGLPEPRDSSGVVQLGDSVPLAAGERVVVERLIGGESCVRGQLVDQHGEPGPDQKLWLFRAAADPGRIAQAFHRNAAERSLQTDEMGRFDLGALGVGRWKLAVAPPEANWVSARRLPLANVPNLIAAVGVDFEIDGLGRELELLLTAPRGLCITGRVLGPGGNPTAGADVWAGGPDGRSTAGTVTDAEGEFILGPLVDEPCDVGARHFATGGLAERARAARPGDDLTLQLAPTATLRGVILTDGSALPGEVRCVRLRERPDAAPDQLMWSIDSNTSFEFRLTPPGRYTITARTEDGRFGVTSGIEVHGAEPVEGLEVRLGGAGHVSVRSRHAAGVPLQLVLVREDVPVVLTHVSGGSTTELVCPTGALRLEVHGAGGEPEVHAFELEADGVVAIEVGGS